MLTTTKPKLLILIIAIAVASFSIYYATAGIFKTNTQVVNDLTSGLVGYWTFDGQDMDWSTHTATDVSTNSYNCALDSKYSTSTSPVSGVIGQALDIGNRAVATCGDINEIDGVAHITVSLWLKYSNYKNDATLLVKSNTFALTNGGVSYGDGDDLVVWIDNGATYGWTTGNIISNLLDEWHHVVVVYDGDQSGDNEATLKIYLDNVQQNMSFVGTIPSTSGNTANVFNIGDNSAGMTPMAYADEVRIYDRALSASEITELYNQGAKRLIKTNINQKTNVVGDGLVGYWTFDGQDTDWGTNTTNDLSGNNNTGTMTNMSTTTSPVPGVIGQALDFDGDDDYIIVDDSASLNMVNALTVSMWIRPETAMSRWTMPLNKSESLVTDGYGFFVRGGGLNFFVNHIDYGVASFPTPSAGKWHHIVGTYDSSDVRIYVNGVEGTPMSYSISIGTVGKDLFLGADGYGIFYFDGKLDEVRIYNRALSVSEITELYNQGAEKLLKVNMPQTDLIPNGLVGYWTFDGQDTDWGTNTTNDMSTNSNTGTMENMSTTTSPVPGVIGQALEFDGVDDVISLGDLDIVKGSNNFSISFWAKSNELSALETRVMVSQSNGNPFTSIFRFERKSTQEVVFWVNDKSQTPPESSYPSVDDQWHHYVGVYNGTSVVIYVDTFNGTIVSHSGVTPTSEQNLTIGSWKSLFRFWNGSIDEVRIYNRALNGSEITELYMAGAGR